MKRLGWLILALGAFPLAVVAQAEDSLGLKVVPIPDALLAHLPQLSREGLLIEDAAMDGPAFQGGLRRHDIVLGIEGKAPKSAEELLGKLRDGTGKKLVLSILRQGKERTLLYGSPLADNNAKSVLKPGGLPPVTVQAQPQPDGKIAVTISYYPDKSSKLRRLTCQATVEDLERQFHDLATEKMVPEHVQDLVDVALRRLREIYSPQPKK